MNNIKVSDTELDDILYALFLTSTVFKNDSKVETNKEVKSGLIKMSNSFLRLRKKLMNTIP